MNSNRFARGSIIQDAALLGDTDARTGCTAHRRPVSAGLQPSEISCAERLNEIAEILAAGLQRLLARQSTRKSADFGESSLDIPPEQSVHPEGLASEDPG